MGKKKFTNRFRVPLEERASGSSSMNEMLFWLALMNCYEPEERPAVLERNFDRAAEINRECRGR